MEELYRQTDKYSMLEDNIPVATKTIKIINQSVKGNNPLRKKPFESKEGQSRDRKQSHDQSQKKKKESSYNSPP